jgi:hypothetical protein
VSLFLSLILYQLLLLLLFEQEANMADLISEYTQYQEATVDDGDFGNDAYAEDAGYDEQ